MSDAGIVVKYGTIIQAGEDCDNTRAQLEQSFDRLKDDLKPLVTTWGGAAKDAYDQAQRTWDQSFDDLKQVLAQIGSALPEIARSYQDTDKGAQDLFQG